MSAELCADLPDEFCVSLDYVRNLSYQSRPDYAHLRQLFHQLFTDRGYLHDGIFDWNEHCQLKK